MSSPQSFDPFFLVAMPQMEDPRFSKAVLLMIQHNQEGAIGLIINSPLDIPFEIFALSNGFPAPKEIEKKLIYLGGPVETKQGSVLHQDPSLPHSRLVISDLFLSRNRECIVQMIEKKQTRFQFFLGHASWEPSQLEKEMQQGIWLPAPVQMDLIFDQDPQKIWDLVLFRMGVDPTHLVQGGGSH